MKIYLIPLSKAFREQERNQVRRSLRLQRSLEAKEGLVWVSLQRLLPPAPRKAKENSRYSWQQRLGPASSRQDPCTLPSTSSEENGEGYRLLIAASFPGKRRRRSFCSSTLANSKSATQSRRLQRRSLLSQKGENTAPRDFERIRPIRELKQCWHCQLGAVGQREGDPLFMPERLFHPVPSLFNLNELKVSNKIIWVEPTYKEK